MRSVVALFVVPVIFVVAASAQTPRPANVKDIVELELLTYTEVYDKIHNERATSVLIVTGGIEQRGPQDVLGGHNIMAHRRAVAIAKRLGNTLVAPVFPIAPGASGLKEDTKQPGGIQMPADVYKAVQLAEIESLAWNGFKNIFLMGDHFGGQKEMREAAEEMNTKYAAKGVHVYFVSDFYEKTHEDISLYLYEHKLPIGGHGGMMETSEMLYWETTPGAYVRPIYKTVPFGPINDDPQLWKAQHDARMAGKPLPPEPPGFEEPMGNPHFATKEIGKDIAEIGISNTVAQIKKLMAGSNTNQN